MDKKTSPQTKSFIILFFIAAAGTVFCIYLAGHFAAINDRGYKNPSLNSYTTTIYDTKSGKNSVALPDDSTEAVDTSNWPTYTDSKYNFSFKYPLDWKLVEPVTKQGYYVVALDPGAKYYNVKIYVNPSSYFAMDNLPSRTLTIGGQPAVDVEGVLYGIKYGENYFTFDEGLSTSIKPQFEALVKSVQFSSAK